MQLNVFLTSEILKVLIVSWQLYICFLPVEICFLKSMYPHIRSHEINPKLASSSLGNLTLLKGKYGNHPEVWLACNM